MYYKCTCTTCIITCTCTTCIITCTCDTCTITCTCTKWPIFKSIFFLPLNAIWTFVFKFSNMKLSNFRGAYFQGREIISEVKLKDNYFHNFSSFYPVQCTVYSVYPVHCTVYSVYPVQCTVYSVYPVQCTVYSVQCLPSTYSVYPHISKLIE